MFVQQLGDTIGLTQRANKRHHDLHIGQAHLAADTLNGFTLHGKGLAKIFADIARCTAKTQHRIFFFGLITATANEFAVLIALEI